ncbi:hypothetical protein A3D11_01770 [Candidatus Peribacteria bacterium RIFCSPHIGHO2_02_FULL_49_16]|nr:MAG: hypothetical protein A2880_00880 [Candidatus Peribacteria bacterium RIFCSPHIGHO2_01_FULL_49_38]OGJ58645.1 MAG: hypothetical protein A3D11_01770 [Candidatus Peribacteria bacterium RIFCSPHIGHO2_02_FULL_49_16]
MWLFFALLTPLFFGIVITLDHYCVDDLFDHPWMGVITGSVASFILIIPVLFFAPLLDWENLTLPLIALSLLAGCLIQLSQFFYFHSLKYSEAGIIAAYWNMVPAMVPFLSFFLLEEILGLRQYVGIVLLILASVIFCLIDVTLQTRWRAFFLMGMASLMQAMMFILQDVVFTEVSYLVGFIFITLGLIFTGLTPLLFHTVRRTVQKNTKNILSYVWIFLGIEFINLAALASSQGAVALGKASLVAAVESTMPAYTFVVSSAFFLWKPTLGDLRAHRRLPIKFSIIALMIAGVWITAM